ncbi:hypothetical protein NFI96_026688 [Prochilodus magdalenae]|nr:hypothetical protein NFI96_026688 [Prochilodus magdalenae]
MGSKAQRWCSDIVEAKRAQCLYLNEEPDDLIRQYMVSDVAAIQRGIEESWVSMQPELRELKPWTSMQMLK